MWRLLSPYLESLCSRSQDLHHEQVSITYCRHAAEAFIKVPALESRSQPCFFSFISSSFHHITNILNPFSGFRQHFSLQNYTLQYPYAVHERVPAGWCYVIVVVCPAIIIAFWTLVIDGLFSHSQPSTDEGTGRRVGRYRLKDRLWELNCGILGLALSEGMAFVITGTFKNAVGKPRPDLIDRCRPLAGSADPSPYGLSNSTICTQTDNAILKDGFRSFPSGHSSSKCFTFWQIYISQGARWTDHSAGSFAGLFYLSLYLAAKLHIWDSKGEAWKIFVVIIPSIGAGLIAASRIMDARHHPFDVITGSLLGIMCAFIAYRQYFPPVTETWRKGRAYPIRSWGRDTVPPSAATTSAYEGVTRQDSDAQSAQRRTTTIPMPRNEFAESQANLAGHAAPIDARSPIQQDYPRRRDEWESSSGDDEEEFELRQQQSYTSAANSGMLGANTAYVPRAHLAATTTTQHV